MSVSPPIHRLTDGARTRRVWLSLETRLIATCPRRYCDDAEQSIVNLMSRALVRAVCTRGVRDNSQALRAS